MRQTDYVILGLLSEMPMTGYTIKRVIDIRFRFFWNESYGQLYPALKALARDGYIVETQTEEAKNRAQKAFCITDIGLQALRQWLEQPVEKESVRLEILLKMYFSHLISPDVMLGHIEKFRVQHERDLDLLNSFTAELKPTEQEDPTHPTILRVIDFGRKANLAYLDWCRETIEFLKGRDNE